MRIDEPQAEPMASAIRTAAASWLLRPMRAPMPSAIRTAVASWLLRPMRSDWASRIAVRLSLRLGQREVEQTTGNTLAVDHPNDAPETWY